MSSSLLDIDDYIIKKRFLLEPQIENNGDHELETLFPSLSPLGGAATITPKPGICIKSKNANKKVFINVCTSESIPAPEDITESELIAILESDQPSDFKVPMSLGQLHVETDKSGESCSAYDVVINPRFFDKMIDNPVFHNFFVIVTMEGLDGKYSIFLNKNEWTVLKNKKYHGTMPEQSIRTPLPLVQELSGIRQWMPENIYESSNFKTNTSSSKSPLITELSTKSICNKKSPMEKLVPKFEIRKKSCDTENSSLFIEVEVNLPDAVSGKDIIVDVGEDRIIVETTKHFLDVFLPFSLSNEMALVNFVTSSRVVNIQVPIV